MEPGSRERTTLTAPSHRKGRTRTDEAALALIGQCAAIADTEKLPLLEAAGRVLARNFPAPYDLPPFARSSVDGFAARCADIAGASLAQPVRLAVAGVVDAGTIPAIPEIGPGEALKLITGAALPAGADCVVKQEDCGERGRTVAIAAPLPKGQGMDARGADWRAGELVLQAGTVLGPWQIGVLAGFGVQEIQVWRRVRALVLATGNELAAPGEALKPGKIHSSNQPMLATALKLWGAECVLNNVGDDAPACAALIREAAGSLDLIVTTGGGAAGRRDIIRNTLALLQVSPLPRSGKGRLIAAQYLGRPLLCLPGMPHGAFALLNNAVRPVYAALAHRPDLWPADGGCVTCLA